MSRHLGTWKVPGSSNTPTLSHKKHFEFSSPDPPNVPLGFLHVLPAGAWCCVSPSALYTHDSQKLGIAELTDSSSGQPVNICSPDKMPGLQTQLRGGLGLSDSYSFACCLFFKIKFIFLNFHLCVWARVSVCMPEEAKNRASGLESESQASMSLPCQPICVLRRELRTSRRAARVESFLQVHQMVLYSLANF